MRTIVFVMTLLVNLISGKLVWASQDLWPAVYTGSIEAQIAGLGVAHLNFELDIGSELYEVETTSQSKGLLSIFWKYQTQVFAHGQVVNGSLAAQSYSMNGYSGGRQRKIQLTYGADDNIAHIELDPTPTEEGRQQVPETEIFGARDPADLFLSLINLSARGALKNCAFETKVYDGYRLSKLSLSPPGQTPLRAGLVDVQAQYDLESAHACVINMSLLYGRTPKEQVRADKRKDENQTFIWFAHHKATDITVPAVLARRTRYGTLIVTLADLARIS